MRLSHKIIVIIFSWLHLHLYFLFALQLLLYLLGVYQSCTTKNIIFRLIFFYFFCSLFFLFILQSFLLLFQPLLFFLLLFGFYLFVFSLLLYYSQFFLNCFQIFPLGLFIKQECKLLYKSKQMIFFNLIFFFLSGVESFADCFCELGEVFIIFEDDITIFDLMIVALTFNIQIGETVPSKQSSYLSPCSKRYSAILFVNNVFASTTSTFYLAIYSVGSTLVSTSSVGGGQFLTSSTTAYASASQSSKATSSSLIC